MSKITGHRIWFNGYIIYVSAQTGSTCVANFHIKKKGVETALAVLPLNSEMGKHSSFYIPVAAGDILHCWMEVVTGVVSNPNVDVIIISQ